ncbi:MAG TPA: OmpA family protein [Saprospiraceae bacterium]|nr:OmpA family protein [Saprospiraceae bacterium]
MSTAQETEVQPISEVEKKSESSVFPPKPKNAWELGLHGGHFFIDGDVDTRLPGGYGVGLHLRKAIHYAFSVRADFMYGQTRGLDPQMWSHFSKGGGLVEDVFAPYTNQDGWFPAYKTSYGYLALEGVLNIGNILFHKENNKWNWYTTLGAGLSNFSTKLNLLGDNNQPYSGLSSIKDDFNTKAGRKEIKKKLDNLYDNTYETPSWEKKGIFRLGDETNIHVVFTASVGVSRKLSKRINLGLEHQVMLSDNDMLDGIRFRTAYDQTNNNDIAHYTNLRLAINLGSFDKVTEPLYWLNPLKYQMNDIAELKQRPVFDLTDSDGDGVIDMLDQEPDTPMGAKVDTKGVALDSDGDGIPDYKDKEPFSPPGYLVDKDGKADVKCCITMDDVNKAIDAKWSMSKSDCGKWFLPMVHFDPDKSNVKPEYYGHLHHVATVMKMCPDLCISAIGYSDVNNKNKNKDALSYARAENVADYLVNKYGIDRSRIKVGFGQDVSPTFKNNKGEGYMNRRVEIKVCGEEGNVQLTKPDGADKFKNTGSSKSGSGSGSSTGSFKGDKNSGY